MCQNRERTGVPKRATRLGWWMRPDHFHLSWLRTAYSQRSRHNLKRYRQTANHFAVKLDAHLFVFLNGPRDNLLRQFMRYFIHAQMSAEIKPRSIRQNSEGARVTDRNYIKVSIIQFRVRRDLHSAAIVTCVGNGQFGDTQSSFGLLVDLQNDFSRRSRQGCLHRGGGVREFATQLAWRKTGNPLLSFTAGGATQHLCAHTKAGDVNKESRLALTTVIYKCNATGVDHARASIMQRACRLGDGCRHVKRAAKIAAGTA